MDSSAQSLDSLRAFRDSLYAALSMGRTHKAGVQELLSRHSLEGAELGCPPIYAVDVSVWPRCDAEASPGRGYYYHPSRHSAGQPIVACSGLTNSWPSSASSATRGSLLWTPDD